MDEVIYLFVDGGHLRTIYRELFVPIFGTDYELDCNLIKKNGLHEGHSIMTASTTCKRMEKRRTTSKGV